MKRKGTKTRKHIKKTTIAEAAKKQKKAQKESLEFSQE